MSAWARPFSIPAGDGPPPPSSPFASSWATDQCHCWCDDCAAAVLLVECLWPAPTTCLCILQGSVRTDCQRTRAGAAPWPRMPWDAVGMSSVSGPGRVFVFGDSIPFLAYCDGDALLATTTTTWWVMVFVLAVATESAFHIHSLENVLLPFSPPCHHRILQYPFSSFVAAAGCSTTADRC